MLAAPPSAGQLQRSTLSKPRNVHLGRPLSTIQMAGVRLNFFKDVANAAQVHAACGANGNETVKPNYPTTCHALVFCSSINNARDNEEGTSIGAQQRKDLLKEKEQ